LNADIIRIHQQVEAAMNSGSTGTVADCLQEVNSISADLQQRMRVFLVDFDLQFFLASKEKTLPGDK